MTAQLLHRLEDRLLRTKLGARKGLVRASLEGAFAEPSCPLCRLLLRQEERWLTVLLAESVVDLGIRRRILASWGFCRRHAWAMASRSDLGGPLATAIIYESLSSLLLEHCEVSAGSQNGRDPITPGRPERLDDAVPGHACPACHARAETERNYVDSFIRYCALDGFVRLYQTSDGLCVHHLGQALASARPRVWSMLLADKAAKIEASLQVEAIPSRPPQYTMEAPPEVGHRLGLLQGPLPFFPGSLDHVRYSYPFARVWKLDSGQGDACTACARERAVEQQQLDALLAPEALNDDGDLWLCPEHAWKLHAAAIRRFRPANIDHWSRRWALAVKNELRTLASGAELAARVRFQSWHDARRRLPIAAATAHSCALCAAQVNVRDSWISETISTLTHADPGRGLPNMCLPHAQALLESAPHPEAAIVRRQQLVRLQRLQEELALYIHKVNWDHRDEPWGPERDSWWRIVRFFAGNE